MRGIVPLELRFVAQLAAHGIGMPEVAPQVPAALDQRQLIDVARRHGVLLPFWRGAESTQLLAPDSRQRCRDLLKQEADRVLLSRSEWRVLGQILDGASIRWLAIKGVGLSLQLYQEALARGHGDLDVWVAPEQARKVDRVLRDAGYERASPPPEMDDRALSWHALSSHEAGCYRSPRGSWIEVHTRWHPVPGLSLLEFASCYPAREAHCVWAEATLSVPCLRDHYAGILLHGERSQWRRLKWWLDVERARRCLGDTARDIDAATYGGRPAQRVDWLSRVLLAPAPPLAGALRPWGIALRLRPQPALAAQAHRWPHFNLATTIDEVLLARRWSQRWSVVYTRLLAPTPTELRLLGGRALPVYWLLRPLTALWWMVKRRPRQRRATAATGLPRPPQRGSLSPEFWPPEAARREQEVFTPSYMEAEAVGDELVIRDDRTGRSWSLNATAARAWLGVRAAQHAEQDDMHWPDAVAKLSAAGLLCRSHRPLGDEIPDLQ